MSNMAHERIPELTLGWRLKMALGGMTAQEMAQALEVSRTTVSRWMADRGAPPRTLFLRQWAFMTRTDPAWLLTGKPENPHPALPGGGLDECAVRELNPQPADMGTVWTRRVKGLAKVIPLNIAYPRYPSDEDEAA